MLKISSLRCFPSIYLSFPSLGPSIRHTCVSILYMLGWLKEHLVIICCTYFSWDYKLFVIIQTSPKLQLLKILNVCFQNAKPRHMFCWSAIKFNSVYLYNTRSQQSSRGSLHVKVKILQSYREKNLNPPWAACSSRTRFRYALFSMHPYKHDDLMGSGFAELGNAKH